MIDSKSFINTIESSLEAWYMKHLQISTTQWETRNEGDTISGSAVSKCLRLCWYRWFDEGNREAKDPAFTDKLDIKSKRNMYYGLAAEDMLIEALKEHGVPGGGMVHKAQDCKPVVQQFTIDGVTLSAANDMVVECVDNEGRKSFIPTECKTTDRNFSFKDKITGKWTSPAQWWVAFNGYEEHKRQVQQWIWLAHKNGLTVPFGILFYLRRGTLETKYIVIDAAVEFGQSWENYMEGTEQRNSYLVSSIINKTVPDYDSDIPEIICKGCNYKIQCEGSR